MIGKFIVETRTARRARGLKDDKTGGADRGAYRHSFLQHRLVLIGCSNFFVPPDNSGGVEAAAGH